MTGEEIVVAFIALLGVCGRAFAAVSLGVSRSGPTEPLTAAVSHGSRVRSGIIEGLGSFHLHGIGCRFELDGGEDIDFDWDADGAVVFDSWRLRSFASSIGHGGFPDHDLTTAARDLVRRGVLIEVRDGWFSIPATDPRQ
jgi:hypothetical protein